MLDGFAATQQGGVCPKLRRVALLCLLCIAVAEVAVGRTNFVFPLLPEGQMGTLLGIERIVIRPNPNPKVVIFGTSRARDAFLPAVMERQMGLRRGEVLNIAMGGNDIFDSLVLYERNREILGRAQTIIIHLDSYQFTAKKPGVRFRRLAGWSDRMAFTGAQRRRLICDLFFQVDTVRADLVHYVKEWLRSGGPPPPVGIDRYGRYAVVRADNHNPSRFRPQVLQFWLDEFYKDYKYSPVFEEHLVKLIRMARDDGADVYFVQVPMPGDYLARLKQYPGDPYGHLRANIPPAVQRYARALQFWESPSEAGLTDQDYRDWAHLTSEGAEKWTEFFVRWLNETSQGRPAKS